MSISSEPGAENQESQEVIENATPLATRVGTVIMGRMDFTSVLLRLIGMELYKLRRRLMSKVLGVLAVVLALLVPLAVGLELSITQNTPASQFTPTCQAVNGVAPSAGCSPLSSIAAGSIKQAAIAALTEPLRLPSSLEMATTQGELNPALMLVIILVGSIAGGELSIGTVRLMFARGPWRGQFLLAKYGAALVCVVLGVLVMTLTGVVVGQCINLASGEPQSTAFFTAGWAGHAVLFLLATMLNWFMYAVVAVFFAFLGRSTVAGIVGALTWFFAEPIVSSILTVAGHNLSLFGAFMGALPDYLMGNNARALQLNQAQYLFNTGGSSQSDLQALIILAVYLAVFISLTWWLNENRDVTN